MSLLFLDSDIRKVKYRGKHNDKEEDIHLVEFVDSHIEYNKIQGWHEIRAGAHFVELLTKE